MSYKGFSTVELRRPNRSTFNLSHEKRVTSLIGKLTPILCVETLPNDTFRGESEVLIKLAPLLAPIYHRVNLYVHYFYCPYRLLWKDWETFITGGRLGETVTSPPRPPYVNIGVVMNELEFNPFAESSVADYLGVPPIPIEDQSLWENRSLDVMPFAAFYKVYSDYYRDRNYEADTTILPLASGEVDNATSMSLLFRDYYRCFEHDYFTSSLPFTQRGQEVLMPLAGSGSVTYLETSDFIGANIPNAANAALTTDNLITTKVAPAGQAGNSIRVENIDEVELDSSNVSINDLRRAVRLQEWLERNALAGSRYNESIMAHFGRKTSDSRLQRAEYLGGGKAVVQVDEIFTTAYSEDAESAVVPPANRAGRASTYANTNGFSYNCEEHGFIVGVLSVIPTTAYMQGLHRMFHSRETQLDYPWPTFAHLGEQPVYDYEIYHDTISNPVSGEPPIFGYQSRYAEWKFINSSAHGAFRSTLDFWHLTRKFASQPDLGFDFVHVDRQLQNRIFAVSDTDTLWMYIYNKLSVTRALPYFGTPML